MPFWIHSIIPLTFILRLGKCLLGTPEDVDYGGSAGDGGPYSMLSR